MKKLILIVDFGTSSVRAMVINSMHGETVASWAVPYTIESKQEGWCEISPSLLWNDAQLCVENVLHMIGPSEKNIEVLSFSFFGTNVIPVDIEGKPLCNCILCYDQRGTEEAESINLALGDRKIREILGDLCDSSYMCSKLYWLQHNNQKLFSHSDKFYTIQQYILRNLELPAVADQTMASATGMYDIRTKTWPGEILKVIGVNNAQLPEIVGSDTVLGTIEHFGRVRFSGSIKVTPGAHDMDCGLIGLSLDKNGKPSAAEVTGTFDHVGMIVNSDIIANFDNHGESVWASVGPVQNTSSMVSMFSTSGSLLNWFMKEIAGGTTQQDYADLWQKVSFQGDGIVEVDPRFLSGQGAILNLSITSKRSDIFRAIIETLTFETRRCLELCERYSPDTISQVVIGGGAANARQWIQLKADVTGKRFVKPAIIESSALGAAILASVASGIYGTIRDAEKAMIQIEEEYVPSTEIFAIYDKKYQHYINQYYTDK